MSNTRPYTYAHSAVLVNGKPLDGLTLVEYSDYINEPKAKVKAVGAVIPDGSDIVCEYQLKDHRLRCDVLKNVRRIEGEHYECDSITWADYLPRSAAVTPQAT